MKKNIELLDSSQKEDTVHSLNAIRNESAGQTGLIDLILRDIDSQSASQTDLIDLILRDIDGGSAGDAQTMAHVPSEAAARLSTEPPTWPTFPQSFTTNEEPTNVASNSDFTTTLTQTMDHLFGFSNLDPFCAPWHGGPGGESISPSPHN